MYIALFTTLIAIIFSALSTAILAYVAMATPIGPWMEMTLVLIGTIIFQLCRTSINARMHGLALATAAGGIGAAVAMACAFSFPTLYFLDPITFNIWISQPFYFAAILAGLVIAAGSFGLLIAYYFQGKLLADPAMIFPIGQMVYNMISVQNQLKKAIQLAIGATSAVAFGMIQAFTTFIPARLSLLPGFSLGIFHVPAVATRTDMIPMFWAIGFTTGHVIAFPLLVAVIAKIILVDPVHTVFFKQLTHTDYILAFGAGMAVQGALLGLFDIPKILHKSSMRIFSTAATSGIKHLNIQFFIPLLLVSVSSIFLAYFSFSFLAQLYLLAFTVLCAYQLLIIAGKLGIAPLGRFATFVMIPGLLLFGFSAIQTTLLATFVEISGVVAVDALFGQKVAQLASIKQAKMMLYQWLGLLVCALVIGFIFWNLITHFGLGSIELIASRAQSRAVLVQAFNFNYIVMILGFIFSYGLKFVGVNPTLVFGGLLMGLDTSLMLIAGGLSTYLVKDKEEHYPFWSGVYAANSLWVFIRMLF